MSGYEIALIVGMAVVTFGVRYPVLALVSRVELPATMMQALKYVPPAVLSAIILPEVFFADGQLALRWDNAPLVASTFAVMIAWRTKNLLLTIVLGMAALWSWQWMVLVIAISI